MVSSTHILYKSCFSVKHSSLYTLLVEIVSLFTKYQLTFSPPSLGFIFMPILWPYLYSKGAFEL